MYLLAMKEVFAPGGVKDSSILDPGYTSINFAISLLFLTLAHKVII